MNHPKHIVYCIPHLYNAGGMERVLTQKVNWLVAHTPSVITIVTTERMPEGKTISHFDLDKRVQIIELNIDFNADFQAPLIKKFIAHHRKQRIYRQALEQILQQKKADVCVSLCGKEIEWLGRSTVPCRKIAELHFTYYQRAQQIAVFHSGLLWRMLKPERLIRKVDHFNGYVGFVEHSSVYYDDQSEKRELNIINRK